MQESAGVSQREAYQLSLVGGGLAERGAAGFQNTNPLAYSCLCAHHSAVLYKARGPNLNVQGFRTIPKSKKNTLGVQRAILGALKAFRTFLVQLSDLKMWFLEWEFSSILQMESHDLSNLHGSRATARMGGSSLTHIGDLTERKSKSKNFSRLTLLNPLMLLASVRELGVLSHHLKCEMKSPI